MRWGRCRRTLPSAGADAGRHVFSVTLMTPSTPLTPGQTITVTDTANGSLSGTSLPIAVSAM